MYATACTIRQDIIGSRDKFILSAVVVYKIASSRI